MRWNQQNADGLRVDLPDVAGLARQFEELPRLWNSVSVRSRVTVVFLHGNAILKRGNAGFITESDVSAAPNVASACGSVTSPCGNAPSAFPNGISACGSPISAAPNAAGDPRSRSGARKCRFRRLRRDFCALCWCFRRPGPHRGEFA